MTKRLGFGFMRLPLLDAENTASFDYETLNRLVDTFLEKGFTYFDTALTYHGGLSEEALRKSLVERHPRNSFTVTTKLPPRMLKSAEEQERIFCGQLERCGVDFFDYYIIHNIGTSAYLQAQQFDTFGFLTGKRKEGKIGKLGLSFHDTPELLDEILTAHPELDFIQLQINYADWENPNVQSRRCWEVARAHGLPIVVMEPCKGGNLAQVPAEAEKLLRDYAPQASVPSWAIRFAADCEGVMMVLSGMNTMEQVLDNTATMAEFRPLCDAERSILERVTAILNARTAVPCTACRYCVEGCPRKIAIPEYFSLYNASKRAVTSNTTSQLAYYLNLTTNHGKAADCIACGQCEKACPQHLPIMRYLEEVSGEFDSASLPGR